MPVGIGALGGRELWPKLVPPKREELPWVAAKLWAISGGKVAESPSPGARLGGK